MCEIAYPVVRFLYSPCPPETAADRANTSFTVSSVIQISGQKKSTADTSMCTAVLKGKDSVGVILSLSYGGVIAPCRCWQEWKKGCSFFNGKSYRPKIFSFSRLYLVFIMFSVKIRQLPHNRI